MSWQNRESQRILKRQTKQVTPETFTSSKITKYSSQGTGKRAFPQPNTKTQFTGASQFTPFFAPHYNPPIGTKKPSKTNSPLPPPKPVFNELYFHGKAGNKARAGATAWRIK